MKIVYGLCGEGRGHCARFLAVAPLLNAEFLVFAGDDAYQFLHKERSCYKAGIQARFVQVPPFKFQYKNGKTEVIASVANHAEKVLRLKAQAVIPYDILADVERAVFEFQPDFIINDDEPYLCHIKRSVPLILLDRFAKVAFCEPPKNHKNVFYGTEKFLNVFIYKLLMRKPDYIITSTFYDSEPLKEFEENITSVGPLLREIVLNQNVSDDGHVVVYATNPYVYTENLMQMIRSIPRKVFIYGSSQTGKYDNIEYCEFDGSKFVQHIGKSAYVISTPGNMLLSEVRYLKKRIILLSTDSFEQRENIIWAQKLGFGSPINYKTPPKASEIEDIVMSLKEPEDTTDHTLEVVDKIIEIVST